MHYASKSRWVTSMILRHNLVDPISIAVSLFDLTSYFII